MMNKLMVVLLFGSGILLGFSNFFHRDELTPVYIAALILVLLPVAFFHNSIKTQSARDARAFALLNEAQNLAIVKRDAKSKIPKDRPRRESPVAFEGSTKVGAVRSMAALVRKPMLREKIIEICDFADVVLETIRRLPNDTPAARTFCETHLSRLTEALEHCFEMHRNNDAPDSGQSLAEIHEVECFSTFITVFKRQQDTILFEGTKAAVASPDAQKI
ncbi:MAG: hypothetical protein LBT31_01635 [Synergistaceae bacterium]|jgi:hypothetical protein|nr:hypothetical protein [Synergistaceae bacterium]